MGFTPSNGTKYYIAAASPIDEDDAPLDAAAYAALTWTEVKGVTNIGDFGDSSSDITSTELGDDRVQHAKGARDGGTPAIVCNNKPGDAGQQAMYASEAQPFDYPMKVVFPNKKTPSGVGSTRFFNGKVMSVREGVGAANNPISVTFNIGINSPTVRVAAS